MSHRLASLAVLAASGLLLTSPLAPQEQPKAPVRPARVEQIQNLELAVTTSFRPAYIPLEWGRPFALTRLDALNHALLLEAENGDIFIVGLSQRGTTLFLDTSAQGGVVTVIRRKP